MARSRGPVEVEQSPDSEANKRFIDHQGRAAVLTCRARVQWPVILHLFLDLPRHMQPPRAHRYARHVAMPNCLQEALKP